MSARRRGAETPQAGGEPAPLAWLETLEARVHDAVERLSATTAENTRLRERVAELESRLAAGEAGESGAGDADRETWRREREEARERVTRLAESLEALLGEAEGQDEREGGGGAGEGKPEGEPERGGEPEGLEP